MSMFKKFVHSLRRTGKALQTPCNGPRGNGGMTLIEIIIAISLIVGLMAYLATNLTQTADNARKDEARLAMGAIEQSLQMYRVHNHQYPTTDQGLDALQKDPGGQQNWRGPYIDDQKLIDPWGQKFQYESDGRKFTITSGGPDRQIGTEDDVRYPEEKKTGE